MKTWQLWRALRNPQLEHPMYQRFITMTQHQPRLKFTDVIPIPKVFFNSSLWGFLSGFALVIFMCAGGWILVLPALAIIPFIPLTGTLYGLFMAIRIAGYMTQERQKNRYILMALTPHGLGGVTWAIVSVVFHRGKNVSQLRDLVMGLYTVLFLVFGLLLMVSMVNTLFLENVPITPNDWLLTIERYDFLRNTFLFGIAVSAFFLDFLQSIITGVLIGMLVPTMTRNAVNARGLALGLYLLLQFGMYAIIALVALFVVPVLVQQFYWSNIVMQSAMQLIFFFVTREMLIIGLWRRIAYRFVATTAELDYVVSRRY